MVVLYYSALRQQGTTRTTKTRTSRNSSKIRTKTVRNSKTRTEKSRTNRKTEIIKEKPSFWKYDEFYQSPPIIGGFSIKKYCKNTCKSKKYMLYLYKIQTLVGTF